MQSSPSANLIAPTAAVTPKSHGLGVDEFSPGRCDRLNTGISDPSSNFDGADNVRNPFQSLDSVENGVLLDLKTSNAVEQTTSTSKCNKSEPSYWQQNEEHNIELTAKLLIHMSSGQSLAPFNEKFGVSSSDWCRVSSGGSAMDFATDAVEIDAMHSSQFKDNSTCNGSPLRSPSLSNYPYNEKFGVPSSDWCRVSSGGSAMDFAADAVEIDAIQSSQFTDDSTCNELSPPSPSLSNYGYVKFSAKHLLDPPKLQSNPTLYMGNQSANTAVTFDRCLSWLDISHGYQANEYKFVAIRFFNGETTVFTLDDPEQFHHVETIVTGSIEVNVVGWIASKEKIDLNTLTQKNYHEECTINKNTKPMSTIDESRAIKPNEEGTINKKRKPRRTIDESCAIEPTDDDVLFGRGGHTNLHPGNIRFREKARELRKWYEGCHSKEDKYHVSNVMVDCFKSKGHRFLEKGSDGLWHEVIGNGARKKASQALRERIGGKIKKEKNLHPTGEETKLPCPTAWPSYCSERR
jgi:hypothetical protein